MDTLLIINNFNCHFVHLRLTLLMDFMIQQIRLQHLFQQKH